MTRWREIVGDRLPREDHPRTQEVSRLQYKLRVEYSCQRDQRAVIRAFFGLSEVFTGLLV